MNPSQRLLTVEEVACLLAVKPGTIYDAASRGRLPVVRLWEGRRRALIRFRPDDIQRLIDERTVPAGPAEANA